MQAKNTALGTINSEMQSVILTRMSGETKSQRIIGQRDDPRFSNTTGILQKQKTMWFIGVEVEQETSAPPPKKNPGSAPETPSITALGDQLNA